jgi:hypothetical protein
MKTGLATTLILSQVPAGCAKHANRSRSHAQRVEICVEAVVRQG